MCVRVCLCVCMCARNPPSLNPFLAAPLTDEGWEDDDQSSVIPGSFLDAEASLGHVGKGAGPPGVNFLLDQAEDFLIADDPAMFSDDFSDPDDWTLNG